MLPSLGVPLSSWISNTRPRIKVKLSPMRLARFSYLFSMSLTKLVNCIYMISLISFWCYVLSTMADIKSAVICSISFSLDPARSLALSRPCLISSALVLMKLVSFRMMMLMMSDPLMGLSSREYMVADEPYSNMSPRD